MQVTNLLDIHTRQELYQWYLDNHDLFVYEDWVINAIKADAQAWSFYNSCPDNYRRIKVDRIQHYRHTNRPEYAEKTMQKFIQDCHNGKMQSGWSDFGRN